MTRPALAALGCLAAALLACGEDARPSESIPQPEGVRLGARVLLDERLSDYAGVRAGLIAHGASVLEGERLVDLLAARDEIELVRLFGPEHGFGGTAAAGEEVTEGLDTATGLPVFSLYGEHRAPTPESLEDLDVLFFDLQDVGSRTFTYISTMGYAMQAAARAGVRFVVLDRPNPLGGELVEGFVLDTEVARSFVGLYPIPTVHGLTVGELAQMIVGEGWLDELDPLELDVVPTTGWRRDQLWPDTGLPWSPPSPNLATFEAALHYPGTCLFEGTTLNEGRGTDAPFELFGAPWLDSRALDGLRLAGVRLEATTTTPQSSWRAGSPRFEGETIPALRLVVEDPGAVRPLANGVELLARIRDAEGTPEEWLDPRWLDLLAGGPRVRDQLLSGHSGAEIAASWIEEAEAFSVRRRPYLIYPER